MTNVNSNSSLITLNVNSLNTPIKRQRLTEKMKSHDQSIWCLQWTYIIFKNTNSLKHVKNILCNGNLRRDVIAVLISDEKHLRQRELQETKEI